MDASEKQTAKMMVKFIFDCKYLSDVYETILRGHVQDWEALVEAANHSEDLTSLRKMYDDIRANLEKLIDENEMASLLPRLPKPRRVH